MPAPGPASRIYLEEIYELRRGRGREKMMSENYLGTIKIRQHSNRQNLFVLCEKRRHNITGV
jgi:hypothetical protein